MSKLTNKDRENLAAYLDGELDPATAQALEAKIKLDPDARKEVEALKKTWGLLDHLPQPRPTTGFTQRTMERLTQDKLGRAGKTVSLRHSHSLWRLQVLVWSCALLGLAGVGYGAGRLLFRQASAQTVVEDPAPSTADDLNWVKYQPKVVRDLYRRLSVEARRDLVQKLSDDERQRHRDWQMAKPFLKELDAGIPLPSRLGDFPPDVVTFVTEYLLPVLSQDEKERLDKAQGHWPLYPRTLVALADRHPPALPGPIGPKSFAELPTDAKNRLRNAKGGVLKKLNLLERHWPQFGIGVADVAAARNIVLLHEFLPWGHSCLSLPMQEFVDKKLAPTMDNDDKLRLISAERKWPKYPMAIQEIAAKHNLTVPWLTMPGSRERWQNYRDYH